VNILLQCFVEFCRVVRDFFWNKVGQLVC